MTLYGEASRDVGARKWLLGSLALLAVGLSQAQAEEVRDFTIYVDGKPAGSSQMVITAQQGGVVVMSAKANVRLRVFLKTYVYSYDGTEVWKGPRLQSLRSTSEDDGKRYQVAIQAEASGLRVQVNGADRMARADAWLTSYWRLPEAKYRNQAVPLIEPDTGRVIGGSLKYIGQEQAQVGGQRITCAHYRVTGGPSPVDLWYDGAERLVREDYVEQGHRTIVQLTGTH
jgi:hypothetical protein